MTERIKNESGYSLVEVMVAIMLLAIAIIPMVGMFDAGLRAASTSGNYDKARALANANLESAKAMDLSEVENMSSCVREEYPPFRCEPVIVPLRLNDTGPYSADFEEDPGNANPDMLKVTITVEWGSNNEYSTSGVVAE